MVQLLVPELEMEDGRENGKDTKCRNEPVSSDEDSPMKAIPSKNGSLNALIAFGKLKLPAVTAKEKDSTMSCQCHAITGPSGCLQLDQLHGAAITCTSKNFTVGPSHERIRTERQIPVFKTGQRGKVTLPPKKNLLLRNPPTQVQMSIKGNLEEIVHCLKIASAQDPAQVQFKAKLASIDCLPVLKNHIRQGIPQMMPPRKHLRTRKSVPNFIPVMAHDLMEAVLCGSNRNGESARSVEQPTAAPLPPSEHLSVNWPQSILKVPLVTSLMPPKKNLRMRKTFSDVNGSQKETITGVMPFAHKSNSNASIEHVVQVLPASLPLSSETPRIQLRRHKSQPPRKRKPGYSNNLSGNHGSTISVDQNNSSLLELDLNEPSLLHGAESQGLASVNLDLTHLSARNKKTKAIRTNSLPPAKKFRAKHHTPLIKTAKARSPRGRPRKMEVGQKCPRKWKSIIGAMHYIGFDRLPAIPSNRGRLPRRRQKGTNPNPAQITEYKYTIQDLLSSCKIDATSHRASKLPSPSPRRVAWPSAPVLNQTQVPNSRLQALARLKSRRMRTQDPLVQPPDANPTAANRVSHAPCISHNGGCVTIFKPPGTTVHHQKLCNIAKIPAPTHAPPEPEASRTTLGSSLTSVVQIPKVPSTSGCVNASRTAMECYGRGTSTGVARSHVTLPQVPSDVTNAAGFVHRPILASQGNLQDANKIQSTNCVGREPPMNPPKLRLKRVLQNLRDRTRLNPTEMSNQQVPETTADRNDVNCNCEFANKPNVVSLNSDRTELKVRIQEIDAAIKCVETEIQRLRENAGDIELSNAVMNLRYPDLL